MSRQRDTHPEACLGPALDARPRRRSSSPGAVALAMGMGLLLGLGGCARTSGDGWEPETSTETGNPPFVDKLLVSLVVAEDRVSLVGQAGAVTPGGAEVTVQVAGTDKQVTVTAEADGSFEVVAPGGPHDVYLVFASGNDAEPPGPPVFVFQGGAQVVGGDGDALSCEARDQVIEAALGAAVPSGDVSCQEDTDCVDIAAGSQCYLGDAWPCGDGPPASQEALPAINQVLNGLFASVCNGYAEQGCFEDKPMPTCEPGGVECIAGRCVRGTGVRTPPFTPTPVTPPRAAAPLPTPASSGPVPVPITPTSMPLSCEVREAGIDAQLAPAVASADRSCAFDSDCVAAAGPTQCAHEAFWCGVPAVNLGGAAAIANVVADLEAGPLCDAGYFPDGCTQRGPVGCIQRTPVCNAGQCDACVDGLGSSDCMQKSTPGCAPQLVQYAGDCQTPERYHWLGDSCQGLNGCECTGPDCSRSYDTYEACQAAHDSCDTSANSLCGGIAGFQCQDGEYCAYVPGNRCGASDATGICQPIPEGCDDNYEPVCGCDGLTYSNACEAGAASTGIQSLGECGA